MHIVFFRHYEFVVKKSFKQTFVKWSPGPRFPKIPKSFKFVTPLFKHRLNEFIGRKTSVQTFVKWT